jgi:phosphohistidine phosphatase
VQAVQGAQNHNVLNVHEDVSTRAKQQLSAGVEFGKRSIGLLRHAEAKAASGIDDKDRQLTERGLHEAGLVGKYLQNREEDLHQVVFCSNATRTLQTLECIQKHVKFQNIYYLSSLYNATHAEVIKHVEGIDECYSRALVIAHNPGISSVALELATRSRAASHDLMNFEATAKLVCLKLQGDSWADISNSTAIGCSVFIPTGGASGF